MEELLYILSTIFTRFCVVFGDGLQIDILQKSIRVNGVGVSNGGMLPRGSRTFDPTYQVGRLVRPPGRLKKNPTFAEFGFQTAQKRQQCRPRRLSCRK